MLSEALAFLQWPGVVLGLAGALLVSQSDSRRRRIGFLTWIVSNICLVLYALTIGAWGLLGMYIFYGLTSALGVKNNLSRKEGSSA